MTLDDWQAVGIVCGALLALLTLISVLYRKVIRPVFKSLKLAARLLEQLVGDPADGVPSLMERLARFDANQTEMARKLDDHLEWHANPGGRPARSTVPRPNGPAPGRR